MISLIDKRANNDVNMSRLVVKEAPLTPDIITEWPWTPVILQEKANWLAQKNFKEIHYLVFDIDNDPDQLKLSLADAVKKFANYNHIIGISRNHQKIKTTKSGKEKPPSDRYRVILKFNQPVMSIDSYKASWEYYANFFNIAGVADSLDDLARFYWPCKEVVSVSDTGELLPGIAKKERSLKTTVSTPIVGRKLTPLTLAFLAQEDNNLVDWHKKFVRAAFDLKGKGYSLDEAEEKLKRASPHFELDSEDIKQLRDVYKRESFFKASRHNFPEVYPPDHKRAGFPIRESVLNLEYVVKDILNFKLFYDDRQQKVIKNIKYGPQFTQQDFVKVKYSCLANKIMSNEGDVDTVITHLAFENSYDPLKEVFETESWDGTDYLEQLFLTLKLRDDVSEKDMYWYREFFKRWFRGMAAKYYQPGSANNVLIFVGLQGRGKSRWLSKLGSVWPDGYREGAVDPANKDHALIHVENFLWHIAELDNTTRNKDVNALKEFLTRESVSERRPYARKPETGKSICSFCASVNSTDFLRDTTGNRRYLPLPVMSTNPDHDIPLRQVYAQAAAEFKEGKPWYFTLAECDAMDYLIDMYRYKDPLMERLEQLLAPGEDAVTVHEIVDAVARVGDNFGANKQDYYKQQVSGFLAKKGFMFKNHSGKKVYHVDLKKLKQTELKAVN